MPWWPRVARLRQSFPATGSRRSWNTLVPGLQASTIFSQRPSGQGSFCTLCRGVDHTRAQCALICLEPSVPSAAPPSRSSSMQRRQNICISGNVCFQASAHIATYVQPVRALTIKRKTAAIHPCHQLTGIPPIYHIRGLPHQCQPLSENPLARYVT